MMLFYLRFTFFLLISVSLKGLTHQNLQPASPNVILIIADQMRGDALGILNHPNIKTPHLDKMAREGVLFTHYFTNNPVCVPSRMSMFSGKHPHEHGALSNKGPNIRFDSADNTLLGYFNEKGYRLGWFGKDNHTYSRPLLDSLLVANSSRRREDFRAYQAHTAPHWASASPWPKEELFAYRTTTDAIDFISQESNTPFFAVLSLFDPHPPYFAPAEYVAKYPIQDITVPGYVEPAALSSRLAGHKRAMRFDLLTEDDLKHTMAHYYAAIEWGIDAQVGRILRSLEMMDLDEQTIILFTSEHGDFMGEYGMVRKGMFLYDALLRVPFIWYGPGQIQQGVQSNMMTQSVDIFPTLTELTGGTAPKTAGESLATILTGSGTTPGSDRTIFASAGYTPLEQDYFDSPEPIYFSQDSRELRPFHTRILQLQSQPTKKTLMVRNKDWKLILSETHPPEMYFMDTGWTERENLASDSLYSQQLNTLMALAEKHWTWD